MKIRRARLEDASPLARLMKLIIGDTPYYSPEARKEEIRKHNKPHLEEYLSDSKYYTCLVAEEDRKIIGFLIGRNEAGVFWSDWLGVHVSFRGKHIAESLMKNLEKTIKQKGVHKIWCDTRNTNKESISLLKKLKYSKLGLFQNGWYKQDFFLWEKDIA